jgi:hypothetical protein
MNKETSEAFKIYDEGIKEYELKQFRINTAGMIAWNLVAVVYLFIGLQGLTNWVNGRVLTELQMNILFCSGILVFLQQFLQWIKYPATYCEINI